MSNHLLVKTSYANIYSEPTFSSQMISQALFFESLKIISEDGNWYEVSQWDGYTGYVHRFYLAEKGFLGEDVFISNRSTPLFINESHRDIAIIATFGAIISAERISDKNYKTSIDSTDLYFNFNEDSAGLDKRARIKEYSKTLIGSPYLWGGKSSFGYDCSGFVQSLYKSIGIDIKRDTTEQIDDSRMDTIEYDSAKVGDLIFFSIEGEGVDHVGLHYNENHVIHCGGEVKVQSIHDDTHKPLSHSILTVKSMDRLI